MAAGSKEPGAAWHIATVASVHDETPRVKLFRLNLPESLLKRGFHAGQYFDIRLTAADGYQAQRSYSITSSPDQPNLIELAIELVADGEVSSYFHESVEVGDRIEIRGFGSFSLHFRAARIGRNPRTGTAVQLPARYVPHFKPGKALRDQVNNKV